MKLYICDFCNDYNEVEMFVFKQEPLGNTCRNDGFGGFSVSSAAVREIHICNTCFAKKFVRPGKEKQGEIVISFIGCVG